MPLDLGKSEAKFLLVQDGSLNFRFRGNIYFPAPHRSPLSLWWKYGGPKVHVWFSLFQAHQRQSTLEPQPDTH